MSLFKPRELIHDTRIRTVVVRSATGALFCSALVQTILPTTWAEASHWLYVSLFAAVLLSVAGTDEDIAFLVGLLLPFVALEPAPYDILLGVLLLLRWLGPAAIRWLRKPLRLKVSLEDWFVIAFAGGSVVSAIVNHGDYFFLAVTMYLLSSYVVFGRSRPAVTRALVMGYVAGALLEYLLVSIWRLLNEPFLSRVMFGSWRVKGTFKDPNVFGAFYIPLFLGSIDALLCRSWSKESAYRTIGLFALAILSAHAILASYSRGAVIASVVGLLVLGFIRLRNGSPTLMYKAVGLLLVVPVLGFSLETAITFTQKTFHSSEIVRVEKSSSSVRVTSEVASRVHERASLKPYDNKRFSVQAAALALAPSHPLGIGPGRILERFNYDAHSLYIRVLVENGWIAFTGMCGWMVLIAFRLLLQHREETTRNQTPALLAAIAAYCLDSLVISTLHWRHFWLLFATATAAVRLTANAEPFRTLRRTGGDNC